MGDVALITPVIRAMRIQYPESELIILTRRIFSPLFPQDDGIKLFTPDFRKRHKGLPGIIRLFRDLIKEGKIDYVIDLHNVIRTRILTTLFMVWRVPVTKLDKQRKTKNSIIRGRSKSAMNHVVERYRDAFSDAGYPLTLYHGPSILPGQESLQKSKEMMGDFNGINIGIAPYARHHLKVWPEEYTIRLLTMISEKYRVRLWILGGKEDEDKIRNLVRRVPGSISLCGKISLEEELAMIFGFDFMISMDSSNMHMAALVGTKVVSIWGGTDPVTGFGAWQQPGEYSIRIPLEELTCRPCTVYGKGKCKRGDFACMIWQTPEIVFEKILKLGVLDMK